MQHVTTGDLAAAVTAHTVGQRHQIAVVFAGIGHRPILVVSDKLVVNKYHVLVIMPDTAYIAGG